MKSFENFFNSYREFLFFKFFFSSRIFIYISVHTVVRLPIIFAAVDNLNVSFVNAYCTYHPNLHFTCIIRSRFVPRGCQEGVSCAAFQVHTAARIVLEFSWFIPSVYSPRTTHTLTEIRRNARGSFHPNCLVFLFAGVSLPRASLFSLAAYPSNNARRRTVQRV